MILKDYFNTENGVKLYIANRATETVKLINDYLDDVYKARAELSNLNLKISTSAVVLYDKVVKLYEKIDKEIDRVEDGEYKNLLIKTKRVLDVEGNDGVEDEIKLYNDECHQYLKDTPTPFEQLKEFIREYFIDKVKLYWIYCPLAVIIQNRYGLKRDFEAIYDGLDSDGKSFYNGFIKPVLESIFELYKNITVAKIETVGNDNIPNWWIPDEIDLTSDGFITKLKEQLENIDRFIESVVNEYDDYVVKSSDGRTLRPIAYESLIDKLKEFREGYFSSHKEAIEKSFNSLAVDDIEDLRENFKYYVNVIEDIVLINNTFINYIYQNIVTKIIELRKLETDVTEVEVVGALGGRINQLPEAPQSGQSDFRQKADIYFRKLVDFSAEIENFRLDFNRVLYTALKDGSGFLNRVDDTLKEIRKYYDDLNEYASKVSSVKSALSEILGDVDRYKDSAIKDFRERLQSINLNINRNISDKLDSALKDIDDSKDSTLLSLQDKFDSFKDDIQAVQNELEALVTADVLYMQDSVDYVDGKQSEIEKFVSDSKNEIESTIQSAKDDIDGKKDEAVTETFANAYVAEEIKEDFIDKIEEKEETLQNLQQNIDKQITDEFALTYTAVEVQDEIVQNFKKTTKEFDNVRKEVDKQIADEFAIAYALNESKEDLKEAIVNSDFTKSVSNQVFTIANDGDNEFIVDGGYVEGNLLVSFNGILLDSDDYVADDGVKVKLNTDDTSKGDVVVVYVFTPFRVVNTYTKREIDKMFEVKEW